MWLHKGRNQRIGSLRPEIQLHLLLYSSSYIYPDHVLLCDTKPLKPHNLDLDYKTPTQSSRKGPYYIKLHSNMNNLNKNRMTMPLFLAFCCPTTAFYIGKGHANEKANNIEHWHTRKCFTYITTSIRGEDSWCYVCPSWKVESGW